MPPPVKNYDPDIVLPTVVMGEGIDFEQPPTITISLEQAPDNLNAPKTGEFLQLNYVFLGEGCYSVNGTSLMLRQGDVCLLGTGFLTPVRRQATLHGNNCGLIIGRIYLRVTAAWLQFFALPENGWMQQLLEWSKNGLLVRGDQDTDLDTLFRQLLTGNKEISSVRFIKYLREIFELQSRTRSNRPGASFLSHLQTPDNL